MIEQKLRLVHGIRHASASASTGRMLILFVADLSQQAILDVVEQALAVALEELQRAPAPALPEPARASASFFSTRRAQLQEFAPVESEESKRADRKANRDLAIAFISFGLATAGALGLPALSAASVVGFLYVTFPVFKNAAKALKDGKVNTSTMVAITSIGGIVNGHFWLLSYGSLFYPASRRLLVAIQDRSRRSLVDVFKDHPHAVRALRDGVEVEIPFTELQPGDIIAVSAGHVVPADGIVTGGNASVDQHIVTGEAQPVEKAAGDQVLAMTSVLSGHISVEVKATGTATLVGRVGEILNHTAESKSTVQLRAEALADRTVLPTIIAGGVALPFLGLGGALAVVNAHFRQKVSVVAPLSMLTFLHRASQHGILVKDGRSLDLLNQVDTVVFDKTGTLTAERPHVGSVHCWAEYSEDEILLHAAAVEQNQSHPFAAAILNEVTLRQLSARPVVEETEYEIGYGLTASVDGRRVRVGSLRFMEEMAGIAVSPEMRATWTRCSSHGHSMVMVAIGGRLAGAIELLPTIRPETRRVIATLRRRPNIQSIYIISGDHEAPTGKVAQDLGVDRYFSQTLPEDKAGIIAGLQAEGRRVCYMGDGINDAIALKRADVSISLRGASSVATDTAQIVLMDGTLNQVGYLFDLAQRFVTSMNTTFAVVVTPSVIGMAGAVFLRFGLIHTVLLSHLALVGGLLSAMAPRLGEPMRRDELVRVADTQLLDVPG